MQRSALTLAQTAREVREVREVRSLVLCCVPLDLVEQLQLQGGTRATFRWGQRVEAERAVEDGGEGNVLQGPEEVGAVHCD